MTHLLTPVAQSLRQSPTLEINEKVTEKLQRGERVIHLGFGEAQFPVEKSLLEKYRENSSRTSYLPVAGVLELRQAIAEHSTSKLGVKISADHVIVAPGSKPLLFALFDIISGDVLLPRPSWVSYEPQIQLAGKKLMWVETDEHDRHSITESALEQAYLRAIQSNQTPKIMLINSPSNPTGHTFSTSSLKFIAEFCNSRGITLISDEIYSDLTFGENPHPSVFKYFPENIIVTAGISKTYSAGGWRVGYAIILNSTLRRSLISYASEAWSSAPSPAQYASITAFSSQLDSHRKSVAKLHEYCTMKFFNSLKELGLEVSEPKGGFYVYPSFAPFSSSLEKLHIKNSSDLSKWLIDEFGIATLPGAVFGEDDVNGLSGGKFRLRMATSCLWFSDEEDRWSRGYDVLDGKNLHIAKLDDAILALKNAVAKLKAIE